MFIARCLAIATVVVAGPLTANAGTFTTLYSFTGGGSDGGYPGSLVYRDGTLYGVAGGGAGPSAGKVFKFDVAKGTLTVLYSFKGGSDGVYPNDVIYEKGMLYGTTEKGGSSDVGTVFAVNTKTKAETILYSFATEDKEAAYVFPGGLIYENGVLYGLEEQGGANNIGEVFAVNPSTGAETDLHDFGSAANDGALPFTSLIFSNSLLYGVTLRGGPNSCVDVLDGCGTVFSIDPTTGAESTFYAFTHGSDGYWPYSNLVYHDGMFFGATLNGGNKACKHGCGIGFAINAATGVETVLDKYTYEGESPSSEIVVGGKAYETLGTGTGVYGELVEVNLKSGHQAVLYTFTGGADGADPTGPLVYSKGTLYGTTPVGGKSNYGTIFKYVP
jgi:uncharacterized repeat protein (TIGR03803 family)